MKLQKRQDCIDSPFVTWIFIFYAILDPSSGIQSFQNPEYFTTKF